MTSNSPPATGSYEQLAPFYDAFTATSDYENWTDQILALLRSYGWGGNTVLDVACGTGNSFLPLVRRGFDVTGCDRSPAMLAEAGRKGSGVPLVEADVRLLPSIGPFDLITCIDDSLNHLLDEHELSSGLASVSRSLSSSGLLVFDLNTLLAYRTTFATDSVFERDGLTFAWRGDSNREAPPECRVGAQIDVFAQGDDGLYTRVTSSHEQRHFPSHRVVALLAGAGLECLGVHGVLDDGSLVETVDGTRQLKVLYVARPARGGELE
jgi:SAM-dependent methyltransferase